MNVTDIIQHSLIQKRTSNESNFNIDLVTSGRSALYTVLVVISMNINFLIIKNIARLLYLLLSLFVCSFFPRRKRQLRLYDMNERLSRNNLLYTCFKLIIITN